MMEACPGEDWRVVPNLPEATAYINGKLVTLNVVVVGTSIYAGILVGIGLYRPRYRNHHAFVRLLIYGDGANTLFLPIISYLLSLDASMDSVLRPDPGFLQLTSYYIERSLLTELLLIWACLIQLLQTVGISNAATVAADDREAGRNTGLPVAPLLQTIWAAYVVLSQTYLSFHFYADVSELVLLGAFALMFARLVLKCFAFLMAQRSLALRLNPRLIVGYIKQLLQEEDSQSHGQPPQLIVMGEEREQVDEQPHGFYLKRLMMMMPRPSSQQEASMNKDNHLVTIDKIWQLEELEETSKDLCLSFALFKMLRCRFAGYTADETGYARAHDFIWQLLRSTSHDRLLGVITNELSFLHDFYFSSVPISYSKRCLPILSLLISLFTICYCLLVGIRVTYRYSYPDPGTDPDKYWSQLVIERDCRNGTTGGDSSSSSDFVFAGSSLYDLVPIFALLALVMLAEVREVASCICCNWGKVALICRQLYSNKQLLMLYPAVLRFRCNLLNPLEDKMRQCSIILPFYSRKHIITALHHLLIGKFTKNVKVPAAVKAAIVNALGSNNGQLSNGVGFLLQLQDHGGREFLWACIDGKATSDVILAWHIATSILEMKLVQGQQNANSSDNQIIAATHLSRYLAYVVKCWPELLPDDDKWSKRLYDDVSKDSMRVLAMARRGGDGGYKKVMELLTEKSEHEVVKNGVRLGRQLMELEDEAAAWRLLAGVWSEMILYVAPSENLSAHSDAIARGGELITVVWALLMHLGIYTRPSADANSVLSIIHV
uniref:DUF4220 domain-containing protein n=1 Tax=Oryza rufipogon TaxID=4529 RepID=A0A0E0Q3Q4_ORYRU